MSNIQTQPFFAPPQTSSPPPPRHRATVPAAPYTVKRPPRAPGSPPAPPARPRRAVPAWERPPVPMPSRLVGLNYWFWKQLARLVRVQTIRFHTIRPEAMARQGGYVLAVTHLSHLEPIVVAAMYDRPIDWMARREFYRPRVAKLALDSMGCFPVNRQGVPVSSIRTAVARARAGRVVGIFPEGGVAQGEKFVCRGGPMKQGACLVSQRAGVPIVPCVVLGTHALTRVAPWIPFRTLPPRRTDLWIAFGRPIAPHLDDPNRKRARRLQAAELQDAFCDLYAELRERYGIDDATIP